MTDELKKLKEQHIQQGIKSFEEERIRLEYLLENVNAVLKHLRGQLPPLEAQ